MSRARREHGGRDNTLGSMHDAKLSDARAQPERPWVLEARGLSKRYGDKRVVDDASLQLAPGEGVALLGPNGSGKTTLLCLLAGVLRADAGSALVCGAATVRPRARRALAFVPQGAAVYDELTGAENVALFARLAGVPRGAILGQRVARALAVSALERVATQRAATYSGGMRRRLSLACALVHEPSLLLLDEPFEGIDDDSRRGLLDVLTEAKQRGLALVLSTHRLEEASALCERFLELRDGRIVKERATAELPTARPLRAVEAP